jgi:hypothetical protein
VDCTTGQTRTDTSNRRQEGERHEVPRALTDAAVGEDLSIYSAKSSSP